MWVSAVGGSGRRAVILLARMMGIIEPSVHEREPRFFSRDQRKVQERRAHLHVSPEWTNISSEVGRLFAHGARTGVSCTPKVSLCDAMICVVASDFFVASLARRSMCGHAPLLINLGRTGCDVVGKHTWLEPPYPKFLQMTLSDCDEGAVVRLALPTVCSEFDSVCWSSVWE